MKNRKKQNQVNRHVVNLLLCGLLLLPAITSQAQEDSTAGSHHYEGLSLKDLLNIKIVSASKNQEFLFDAPLSASVLTKEEIHRTGCTSIMQAMRLIPGVIVREQSNGNYDIHLRGMDNVPPNASFDIAGTTTLVMLNNRPVYSYLRGGTFWETIPVDINDVERIEVVRGPAAALYGPNAVNGVINIITREVKKEGLYLLANAQQGGDQTFINNASIGYKTGKWSFIASGNYQHRNRTQNSYFEFYRNRWIDDPGYFINFKGDTVRNIRQRFPYQDLAMEKYAGNLFVDYTISKEIKFSLGTGAQHSLVQKVSAENENTPLSTSHSDSRYIDLHAQVKGFTAQFSYNSGDQNVDFDPGNRFDFYTLDASAEYNYTRSKLSIKPGFSYRKTVYDDTKYSDLLKKNGIFNARGEITTLSPSLRVEYKMMNNKLRLVGGIAGNKFNYPDTMYISYQFAATYKLNKNSLLRAVYSSAPRSSNIFDTYVDQTIAYFPSGPQQFTRMGLWGNKELKLFTANMLELGYRSRLSSSFTLDVEVFDIHASNTNVMVTSYPYVRQEGPNSIVEIPIVSTNLPLKVRQHGATVSMAYSSKFVQVKPFITVQRTAISDYSMYHNLPGAAQGVPEHLYSGMGSSFTHKSTPAVYGGVSVNYVPTSKLNINLNSYYYSKQTYHHLANSLLNDGIRGIDTIAAKFILNCTVSYEPVTDLHFFISGKNLLNNKSREFFRADQVPLRLLAGINYEF